MTDDQTRQVMLEFDVLCTVATVRPLSPAEETDLGFMQDLIYRRALAEITPAPFAVHVARQ